jgi:hypothetical protein
MVLMTQLRRVLAPLTAVWLFCQIGAVALVPVALWITTADPHAAECTCGHGPGIMCPMHHKPAGESVPCAMKAANNSGAAVLQTLVGATGLVPEPPRSIEPALPSARARTLDVDVVGERPVPPDPPPPRV